MMDYAEASGELPGRNAQRRKLANNTYLERRSNSTIAVRLHDTDVVTFHGDGRTILNSGGWHTVTTKDRINYYLPSGWRLYQQNREWFLSSPGGVKLSYYDGMALTLNGDKTRLLALRSRPSTQKLAKYADAYLGAFLAGEVPAPSDGDCWFCLFRGQGDGKTMGETFENRSHLESHISKAERYFVPSMLSRAIELFPVAPVSKWLISDMWAGTDNYTEDASGLKASAANQLRKSLYRYLLRQFGYAS